MLTFKNLLVTTMGITLMTKWPKFQCSCQSHQPIEALLLAEIICLVSSFSNTNAPMTDDKLYTSLSANTIMAKLTNHV